MKTIIATLIAAALAVCATVWPPAATASTTPTIELPPAVTAETAPVEPQVEGPAPQQEFSEPNPPTQTADIDTAITAAETFAIETYDVTIDSSLDFTNSAYRFPAAVPLTVDQETLNAKAIDITNYTFEQMMRQNDATIEKMREAGIRCKVLVVQTEQDYHIYCVYC